MRSERIARAFVLLLIALAALLIALAAKLGPDTRANPRDHGQAGEHGKHKGRPFQSPSVPE